MFKPTKAEKKLLCRVQVAYVHKDGIAVWEQRRVKSGKFSTSIDVWHIFPCAIDFHVTDYGGENRFGEYRQPDDVSRLVIHHPRMLAAGLESVRIAFGNSTEVMRERGGLNCTTTILSMEELEFTIDKVHGLIGGSVTVQPDPYDTYTSAAPASIRDYLENENVEVHGKLE